MTHAWYRFYAYLRSDRLKDGWSRDRILAEAGKRGVPLFSGSCSEVYLEKAFDNTGLRPPQRLPGALELGETSLMLLTHPTLSDGDVDWTIEALSAILNESIR